MLDKSNFRTSVEEKARNCKHQWQGVEYDYTSNDFIYDVCEGCLSRKYLKSKNGYVIIDPFGNILEDKKEDE